MPDRLYFRDEFFTVVQCARCGLGFLNPRPTIVEMQKHYPAEYFRNAPTKSNARYMRRRFRREASYLRPIEDRGGSMKLLDVGCADGAFPRFMKARGWDVEGVEISDVAEQIKDFRVHTEEFQNISVHEPTYDAVTAWAVLEHVHDPMAYFCKASAVLKKDGLFVFLVPNFVSLAFIFLRARQCSNIWRRTDCGWKRRTTGAGFTSWRPIIGWVIRCARGCWASNTVTRMFH
jgi:SAM-dependent methyltransferase